MKILVSNSEKLYIKLWEMSISKILIWENKNHPRATETETNVCHFGDLQTKFETASKAWFPPHGYFSYGLIDYYLTNSNKIYTQANFC